MEQQFYTILGGPKKLGVLMLGVGMNSLLAALLSLVFSNHLSINNPVLYSSSMSIFGALNLLFGTTLLKKT